MSATSWAVRAPGTCATTYSARSRHDEPEMPHFSRAARNGCTPCSCGRRGAARGRAEQLVRQRRFAREVKPALSETTACRWRSGPTGASRCARARAIAALTGNSASRWTRNAAAAQIDPPRLDRPPVRLAVRLPLRHDRAALLECVERPPAAAPGQSGRSWPGRRAGERSSSEAPISGCDEPPRVMRDRASRPRDNGGRVARADGHRQRRRDARQPVDDAHRSSSLVTMRAAGQPQRCGPQTPPALSSAARRSRRGAGWHHCAGAPR